MTTLQKYLFLRNKIVRNTIRINIRAQNNLYWNHGTLQCHAFYPLCNGSHFKWFLITNLKLSDEHHPSFLISLLRVLCLCILAFPCSQERVCTIVLKSVSIKFLFLHAPVLKPNFNLPIGEIKHPWELKSFLFVDIHAEEELSFELSDLKFSIGTSLLSNPGST